jgi:hypothetical protein
VPLQGGVVVGDLLADQQLIDIIRGCGTSMNANRRISGNDISNSSDLSNTFMVVMTR